MSGKALLAQQDAFYCPVLSSTQRKAHKTSQTCKAGKTWTGATACLSLLEASYSFCS
jgi:hypothetical protein